jgi:integrase
MSKKLTKKVVDGIATPEEGEVKIWDAELKGFGFRVRASGHRSWFIQYRNASGRTRRYTLGDYGTLTPEEARQEARQKLAAVAKGEDPAEDRKQKREAETVAEFAELYMERHAKVGKKSWQADERRLRKYILPDLGPRPLAEVTRTDISKLYLRIRAEHPHEANRVLSLVSIFFNLAVAWGQLPEGHPNPAKMPKSARFEESPRDRPITSDELPRLLEAVAEETDPHIRSALLLYFITGLRKREILQAQWANLDIARQTLRLPETKTGKPRHVPLSSEAIGIIRSIPRMSGSPFIFPSPVKPDVPRNDLFKPWDRVREKAGCPDLRIHDLRHSVASWLTESGHSAQLIQAALGHASIRTTMGYIHRNAAKEPARNALEGLGGMILDIYKKGSTLGEQAPS